MRQNTAYYLSITPNFPNLDEIFIYNSELILQNKISFKSSLKRYPNAPLFNEKHPGIAARNGITAQKKEIIGKKQFIYEALLFNDYKEEFYRLVGLPISQNLIDLDHPVKSDIRKYVLMVANSSLELNREYVIPFNRYELELKAYFIYKDKLYIQRKTDSEDHLVIDVFEV